MRARRINVLGLAALATLAWLVYSPGLSGAFLFDDFGNLPALGAYGPVTDWNTLWLYLTSGTADPTGRPLSLLSFLIDARDWPAEPYSFKRTNVVIHIGNGLLLFVLLRQLGSIFGSPARAEIAALLGSAFWLLHPLLVSTTLYVVQREAMLPATFVLLGLIGYIAGRTKASQGDTRGTWLAAVSIISCTVVATLCKANGALLPILAWVMDFTLLAKRFPLRADRAGRDFVWMRRALLVLPSLLLVTYLAKLGWQGFVEGTAPHRPWTMGERLMTEGRILIQYLFALWLPRPFTTGLFNDAIDVSTGLLQPWTTLTSLLLIFGLLVFAVRARHRWPAFSLAIGFYFAGHLMESTTVQLELYYEHRNYIPAMLMFWPLALWLTARQPSKTQEQRTHRRPNTLIDVRAKYVLALLFVMGLALLTWMRAELWGNTHEQAALWAVYNPESPRAQAYASQIDMARGDPHRAVHRLEPLLLKKPGELQIAFNLLGAKCAIGALGPQDLAKAATALRTTRTLERMGYEWFQRAIGSLPNASCPALDAGALERLVQAAWQNPHAAKTPGRRQDLYNIQGQLALKLGNYDDALQNFNLALEAEPRPEVALAQAALLAHHGAPEHALRHLDQLDHTSLTSRGKWSSMADIQQSLLARRGYWENEMQHLVAILEQEVAEKASTKAD